MAQRLSSDERARIEAMRAAGLSVDDTARRLGRHRSTVYRELGRGGGRRTVGETFLVKMEGVDPVIEYPERYPAAYRAGLVHGLLFNEQGALCTRAGAVSLVVDLLSVDDELEARLGEIAPLIESSGWIAPPLGLATPTLGQVVEKALVAASQLPVDLRDTWIQAWER